MKFIVSFIDFITNAIRTVWGFFESIVENLIMLFKYIGVVANLCYEMISSIPVWLQAFAVITIVVSILYIILGRNTGGSKE